MFASAEPQQELLYFSLLNCYLGNSDPSNTGTEGKKQRALLMTSLHSRPTELTSAVPLPPPHHWGCIQEAADV